MNINGKILVSVRVKESKKGSTYRSYFATISGKDDDGKSYPVFVSVRFGKNIPADKLKNNWSYLLEVEEGFLTADVYDKEAKLVLVITKATTKEQYETKNAVSNESKDMPF